MTESGECCRNSVRRNRCFWRRSEAVRHRWLAMLLHIHQWSCAALCGICLGEQQFRLSSHARYSPISRRRWPN